VLKEINARLRALERVPGIEPGYSAWKAAALPLSYTRIASGSDSNLPESFEARLRPFWVRRGIPLKAEWWEM
jgi:hypothetical protein